MTQTQLDRARRMVDDEFQGSREQMVREIEALRRRLVHDGAAVINSYGQFRLLKEKS